MQHKIPVDLLNNQVGPKLDEMVTAIETCVHCGFCLATCPTYLVLGEEMDSPRGRILLMKSVLEDQIPLDDVFPYIQRCLGCQACVSVCPSGVRYGDLITSFRAYARGQVKIQAEKKLQRMLVEKTLPYPGRFRTAARVGKLAKKTSGLLPGLFKPMLELLPDKLPEYKHLPEFVPSEGIQQSRAALLVGCVQQVLDPEINWATIRVLARNGIEIVIPKKQTCCGALQLHTGDQETARTFARQNLRFFPADVDVILTNAAGCGSGMKEYPLLFKGKPEEDQAVAFAKKVKDISEYLAELELRPTPPLAKPIKAAYHDACHLAHAQGISLEPRKLLGKIPNLTLIEIADEGICCGSAGTYNIEQPELAAELGRQKAEKIISTGAEAVITGNIGCMVQLRLHLKKIGKPLPVYHTLEILDLAYSRSVD